MTSAAADSDVARLHAACFAGLFCVGVWATAIGPSLPFLADRFDVTLDRAGLLVTALFIGSIAASTATAWRLHVLEARPLCAFGLAIAGAGAVGVAAAPSWLTALASITVLGIGDGLLVAGAHAAVATTSSEPSRAINRLNLWFAVGAIAGPVWAGFVLSNDRGPGAVFVGVAVIAAVAAVAMLRSPRVPLRNLEPDSAPPPLSALKVIAVMGAILFLYVGAEIGLGSWVSAYSTEAFGAGVMAGALVAAGYWAALGAGRVASGMLFARAVPATTVLGLATVGALASSTALALAHGSLAIGVAAALATGLFFGPIWPAAVSIASTNTAGPAPAAMVTIGNAGGILFPWLQGRVLVAGGPGRGMAMTALICAVMLLIAAAYSRPQTSRTAPRHARTGPRP